MEGEHCEGKGGITAWRGNNNSHLFHSAFSALSLSANQLPRLSGLRLSGVSFEITTNVINKYIALTPIFFVLSISALLRTYLGTNQATWHSAQTQCHTILSLCPVAPSVSLCSLATEMPLTISTHKTRLQLGHAAKATCLDPGVRVTLTLPTVHDYSNFIHL